MRAAQPEKSGPLTGLPCPGGPASCAALEGPRESGFLIRETPAPWLAPPPAHPRPEREDPVAVSVGGLAAPGEGVSASDAPGVCPARRTWLQRRLGEGLRMFRTRRFRPMEVGRSSLGDLARNWLGMSASEASELIRTADGCDAHPLLARAFHAGELSRSKLRELLRVVTEDTEAGWIAIAGQVSVSELRLIVGAFLRERQGRPPDEDRQEFVDINIRGPAEIGHRLRIVGRDLVERVHGRKQPLWRVLECLCAEFASEFAHLYPGGEAPPRVPPAGRSEGRIVPPDETELAERCAAWRGSDEPPATALPPPDLPCPESAGSARELLDMLCDLAAARQALQWEAGRAVAAGRRVRGISDRSARRLEAVYRRLERLPVVRDAFREGRLGHNKAWLLTRIAGRDTEELWVQRAERVTLRRLEREVSAMEAFRDLDHRAWRKRTRGEPPSVALLQELRILPGGYREPRWERLEVLANVRRQRFRRPRWSLPEARPANRFRAPPDVAELWNQTLDAVQELLDTASVEKSVFFLIEYFRAVYDQEARALMGRHRILERDGWSCVFPGCSSRKLETHHIRFRAQGGSDEDGNLVALCPAHHRIGVHEGWVFVRGTAPGALEFETAGSAWRNEELQ